MEARNLYFKVRLNLLGWHIKVTIELTASF